MVAAPSRSSPLGAVPLRLRKSKTAKLGNAGMSERVSPERLSLQTSASVWTCGFVGEKRAYDTLPKKKGGVKRARTKRCIHTRMHTHAPTCTHLHMHTHTHTHTHIHTRSRLCPQVHRILRPESGVDVYEEADKVLSRAGQFIDFVRCS